MKKQVNHAFGKNCYLLGADENGIYYWLEESTFDCDWYWSVGYVRTYTHNKCPHRSRDINSHQHFDGLFFNGSKNGYDAFNEFFVETPLNSNEVWKLMELMKTLYIVRDYSDTIYRGGSHYTTNPCVNIIKNNDEYKRINEILMPELLNEVYKLLND